MSSGGGGSQTVGYKYYAGVHMALCHGPADKLVRIRVGEKDAWIGEEAGGQIQIDKPNLFGGEKREGGISGAVDVEMGGPTQVQNSYLASKLGYKLLPAFRGLCCAVLRQVYMGTNPYLKDWAWLLQRIHTRQDGQEQWYGAKAQIGSYSVSDSKYIPPTDLSYKLLFPVGSTWAWLNVPYTDTTDYHLTMSASGAAKAPFADKLNHPYFGSAPWINSGTLFQVINRDDANWFGRTIELKDKRPVHFVFAIDDILTVWINDELVASAVGGPVTTITYTPTTETLKVICKLVDANPTVLNSLNYAYFDAYAYQDEVATSDSWIYYLGDFGDMNPAHIVRECLTDSSWGLGYADADIEDDSFTAAADKLHAEGMGISILWAQQTSLEDFIADILRHIDATLFVDRTTGKFKLKLVRADYVESALLVLDKTNISRVENYTCQTQSDLVNEVTALYHSHEADGQDSVTLQNIALIQQQGAIVPASVEYPGFANQQIAARACARDLKALSTPLVSATIYAKRAAAVLNPGDVFVWEGEEKDEAGNGVVTSYVMRVSDIAYGDGVENAVRIVCSQDVFDLPEIVYVEVPPTEWTSPTADPLPATPRLVMELPYYEIVRKLGDTDANAKLTALPELGYLMVAAGRQEAEINAELQVDSGAGYAEGGVLDFCPCAKLDGAIGRLDTTATLKDGVDLDEFVAGSLAQIDDEIIVIESITDGVATIRRGCLDTVPALHADGAEVVIWDGYAASDNIEYVVSDEADVKILTATGVGLLVLAGAPVDSVVMSQRANRPYPPADVKIGGSYYPSLVVADDLVGIVVAWVHRDRKQQTGGVVLGWTDGGVGPEAGVTYSARLVRTDTEVELDSDAGISGTTVTFAPTYRGEVRLEVWSVRGGLESFQIFEHTFNYLDQMPVYHGTTQVYHGLNEVYYEI